MSTVDLEMEAALISECLLRPDRFTARSLTASDFTAAKHVAVVEAAGRLQERGERVSVGSVALELQRAGLAASVGGERGLAELAVAPAVVADGERLKDLRRLRSVRECATKAAQRAEAGDLQDALASLADASQFGDKGSASELRTAKQLAEAVCETLEGKGRAGQRVPLGLESLTNAVGSMPVGGLMVIAADTGVGKSSFALAMLVALARQGVGCGYISAEDPEDVVGSRMLGFFSNVSSGEVMHSGRTYTETFGKQLERGVTGLAALGDKFLFEDCIGKTDLECRAAMSRMAARGARLVVVDYIGEIASSDKQQDRRNEMRHVAKQLKAHAKRCKVALVLVSQISRPKGDDENKCPSKHALKESGDITNMSEVIVALWREKQDDHVPVRARVVKCKWGGLGTDWSMIRNQNTGCLYEERHVEQERY